MKGSVSLCVYIWSWTSLEGIVVCSELNTYEQTYLCLEVGALYSSNSIPYQANRFSVSVST